MIVTLGKLGLFLLSSFGYWEYFRSKHQINLYFAPVYTIAVQFLVLFAGGLLHVLKEAALGLYIMGFALLLWSLRREKLRVFRTYWDAGYLYFLAAFAAAVFVVYGKRFSQIDNFTHWATVVKNMLSMNRFPIAEDTAVGFSSYPLGTSAFIYYFSVMTDPAEHIQMCAQAYMMVSTILPLFSCVRRNTVACTVLISMMTVFFFTYNVMMTELLVDTLMPLAGMASALFVYHHYAGEQQEKMLSPYYAAALIVWTMNIKHAALIYVAFVLVLLCIFAGKKHGQWKACLLTGCVVFLFREIWGWHCEHAFANVALSQHSMSADWFRLIVGEKSLESIWDTIKRMVVHILMRGEYFWFAAWIALLGLLVWLFLQKEKGRYLAFLLTGTALYGVYVIGLMGMYIFSMPEYEALASFDRYMKSVDIALYYILAVFALLLLSTVEARALLLPAAASLIVTAAAGWYFQTGTYSDMEWYCCTEEERQHLEQPIAEYGIEKRRSYLLCITPEDDALEILFPCYIWRYHMESSEVEQRMIADIEQMNGAQLYDYVIIFDEGNPVIEQWVLENYPEKAGSRVICNIAE